MIEVLDMSIEVLEAQATEQEDVETSQQSSLRALLRLPRDRLFSPSRKEHFFADLKIPSISRTPMASEKKSLRRPTAKAQDAVAEMKTPHFEHCVAESAHLPSLIVSDVSQAQQQAELQENGGQPCDPKSPTLLHSDPEPVEILSPELKLLNLERSKTLTPETTIALPLHQIPEQSERQINGTAVEAGLSLVASSQRSPVKSETSTSKLKTAPVVFERLGKDCYTAINMPLDQNLQQDFDRRIRRRLCGIMRRLKLNDSRISLECAMIGIKDTPAAMKPTILIMCFTHDQRKAIINALNKMDVIPPTLCYKVVIYEQKETSQGNDSSRMGSMIGQTVWIDHQNGNSTLCGAPARIFIREGCEDYSKSTIGGLIIIDDSIFALTTAHGFATAIKENTSPTKDGSAEDVIPYDPSKQTLGTLGTIHSYEWADNSGDIESGDVEEPQDDEDMVSSQDWALVEIPPEMYLENSFRVCKGRNGIEGYVRNEDLGCSEVYVCSGSSGLQKGTLSGSTASIIIDASTFDVRSISLNHELVDGDSGSWVVRDGRLCGYIFCRTVGLPRAYMFPIDSVFREIAKSFSDHRMVYIDVPSGKKLDELSQSKKEAASINKFSDQPLTPNQDSVSLDRLSVELDRAPKGIGPAPPSLQTRFPCWCRAIYSFGGESERDLGFIEGDLIECLNAGDGSWWMGRLRRDKRMAGSFPSNFVEVLDDSFRPASRSSSPVADRLPRVFGQKYRRTAKQNHPTELKSSLGIHGQDYYDEDYGDASINYGLGHYTHLDDPQLPPQSNHVERMESRLGSQHQAGSQQFNRSFDSSTGPQPAVPPKLESYQTRPNSSIRGSVQAEPELSHHKPASEVGRQMLRRTFSATSSLSGAQSVITNSSSSTQATSWSIMSGRSAGAFSSTSAGSHAKKKALQGCDESAMDARMDDHPRSNDGFSSFRLQIPPTSSFVFHSNDASQPPMTQWQVDRHKNTFDSGGRLGGPVAPKSKKTGFFRKVTESAKAGAATAYGSAAVSEPAQSPALLKSIMLGGVQAIAGGASAGAQSNKIAAQGIGLERSIDDWVQVRRDVNRSNSLTIVDQMERRERCQMNDYPLVHPIEELHQTAEGDEGADGKPVLEPTNFQVANLSLVDKNTRFINYLRRMIDPTTLALQFVCRPYTTDLQRLRAIFTWVSETISWEEEFEGDVDLNRVIQTKRGCAREVVALVMEMCVAVGINCEVIQGYLKSPGEMPEIGTMPVSNHWWNAVLVNGEFRMMDCSLASPTNPRHSLYSSTSSTGSQYAETSWFLVRPMEICWTHIPEYQQQQHICPPVATDMLLALPCAYPPFFKNMLEFVDYNSSLLRIEDLELIQIKVIVPADVECVAEVECPIFKRDADNDFFETTNAVKKQALSQAEWVGGQKQYTVKALLPGDEGRGVLKVYAGKRGLMHSIKNNPHPLAFALPIIHTGENPPYDFVTRHPTPYAQRHDLYVVQPQCQRLAINNTFVFAIRQHPSSPSPQNPDPDPTTTSAEPLAGPSSKTAIPESSAAESELDMASGTTGSYEAKRPAKLAIQMPGGKILRLMRREDGSTWETIIKCNEEGVWRGLVLADRSARWCVFAEWTCS